MLTRAEQATQHFYEWEYLGRGYQLFEVPVHLEPPYFPFNQTHFEAPKEFDDGSVPNLFQLAYKEAKKLLAPKKEPEEVVEEYDIVDESEERLTGFSLSFPREEMVSPLHSIEWLNVLSYSYGKISYEIIATHEDITFQIICDQKDKAKIEQHLKAYFPKVILNPIEGQFSIPFDTEESKEIAVVDFGLEQEYMRPLASFDKQAIDPITSFITTIDHLQVGDVAVLQILFKGVQAPWNKDIIQSVSDGAGNSFFENSPEMPQCASEKISHPLFSVVVRLAVQSNSQSRTATIAHELARAISKISGSEYNRLIPLSNEGYNYDRHVLNVFYRKSNRWGMFLNSKELAQLVHYPDASVISSKLGVLDGMAKELPTSCIGNPYKIGINTFQNKEEIVSLNDEMRLRHTHIIGATGVGKSTLISNMMAEDIRNRNGTILFDPHGDIVEDVLTQIPEDRINDVILIDPSDTDFPIGFNLLHATTEAEKIVLSSDLISAFAQHASSWGDQMTSVLSNAINCFLESEKGGTLIELKRFLLEKSFRDTFLKSVKDKSILYYWEYEFPMLKKGSLSPLLTRIDTFLRPKIIRLMLAQKDGVDFNRAIAEQKIILIKLSQGLIGEDNSFLLASLFLSKLLQSAQGRQSLSKQERHPFYVYLDEFQNMITPSITQILSGARKYGMGLNLAHQELAQISDPQVLGSVISNPYIRICFRMGDADAKRLASSFNSFDPEDFQSLDIGQAIMKVGKSSDDFNVQTFPPIEVEKNKAQAIRKAIIGNTRLHYAKPRAEVEAILDSLLPTIGDKEKIKDTSKEDEETIKSESRNDGEEIKESISIDEESLKAEKEEANETPSISEDQKKKLAEQEEQSIRNREHTYLKTFIKKLGQDHGYIATPEKETNTGGKVDMWLERDGVSIACEISVTNTAEYEVQNIEKCLMEEASLVAMVSKNEKHLNSIRQLAEKNLSASSLKKVSFLHPNDLASFLLATIPPMESKTEVIKGFRVTTEFEQDDNDNIKKIRNNIARILAKKNS